MSPETHRSLRLGFVWSHDIGRGCVKTREPAVCRALVRLRLRSFVFSTTELIAPRQQAYAGVRLRTRQLHCSQCLCKSEDLHDAFEVVRQHMQAHFSRDVPKPAHLEVG